MSHEGSKFKRSPIFLGKIKLHDSPSSVLGDEAREWFSSTATNFLGYTFSSNSRCFHFPLSLSLFFFPPLFPRFSRLTPNFFLLLLLLFIVSARLQRQRQGFAKFLLLANRGVWFIAVICFFSPPASNANTIPCCSFHREAKRRGGRRLEARGRRRWHGLGAISGQLDFPWSLLLHPGAYPLLRTEFP